MLCWQHVIKYYTKVTAFKDSGKVNSHLYYMKRKDEKKKQILIYTFMRMNTHIHKVQGGEKSMALQSLLGPLFKVTLAVFIPSSSHDIPLPSASS